MMPAKLVVIFFAGSSHQYALKDSAAQKKAMHPPQMIAT
jgi:hypothetical protein